MKYLVEVEYIIFDNKWADTLIVTSVEDYSKADYKIRQYLQKKYQNLTDIHINSFDFIENVTIK